MMTRSQALKNAVRQVTDPLILSDLMKTTVHMSPKTSLIDSKSKLFSANQRTTTQKEEKENTGNSQSQHKHDQTQI